MIFACDPLELFCMTQVSFPTKIYFLRCVGWILLYTLSAFGKVILNGLTNGGKIVLVSVAHADMRCHMPISISNVWCCTRCHKVSNTSTCNMTWGTQKACMLLEQLYGHHKSSQKTIWVVLHQWAIESNLNN